MLLQFGNTPTAAPATISGVITDVSGSPVAGATVNLSAGRSATTFTRADGSFHFDNLDTDQFYTVTPSLANYHFSPASRSFSLVGNKTEAVFTANANASASANAVDTTEYFIRQQYLDFLGREPDQGGWEYWSGQINQCNGDAGCIRARRIDVSAAFFVEREFQETGSFVYRLYRGALGRQLSYAELSTDRLRVSSGQNLEANKSAYLGTFLQRPEFVERYQQNTTAESFVDALLGTVRDSANLNLASERGNLINRYNSSSTMNESRGLVVRALADNAAFSQAVYNQAFVLMEYFGYLRRDPDRAGYDFWLNVLDNRAPGNYRGMVCAFITSAEYQQRFSLVITRNNLECAR
jgi:hypothetical protein